MSTDAGPFRTSQEPHDPYAEPPRQPRGCLFYGCLVAAVLAVLGLLALALIAFLGYRAYTNVIDRYTAPAPMVLPKVELTDDQRKDLRERIHTFENALEDGEDAEPLVLTGDELNVWLTEDSEVKDRVHFFIEGDKLKGEISIPLAALGLPGLKGRYFNGKATFKASLAEGKLIINPDTVEINGQPLPEDFMTGVRRANLVEESTDKPSIARMLQRLESIEIKDSKVVITPLPKEKRTRGKATTPPEKEEPLKKQEEPAPEPAKTDPPAAPEGLRDRP